jgi:3-hydroxy-9,10-secoandrosta-1,3,5(10)-triene-9,17-dione monooxygenase reductase component
MSADGTPSVAGADFRALMSRWATGVAVVTAREGAADHGLTVNALLSVSLNPPSILISLSRDADTTPVIERTGLFGVSFLAAEQRNVSERFAKAIPPAEKFVGLPVHRRGTGVPLVDGTLGSVECRVVSTTLAFDHALFLGEVVGLDLGPDHPPLVFHHSGYAEPEPEGRLKLPPPRR